MRDDGTVGAATIRTTTTSWASRMNRPTWLVTPDDLRNIRCGGGGVADPATATAHRKPTGFPTDDVLASSPSSGRRGTGAFLPSVPMQNLPTPQHRSLARPSGKGPAPNNSTTTNGSVTKKKQRPSLSASRSGGGPGMHVVFIDSSRPSGTGVFLPRSTGGTDQLRQQQQQPPLHKKQQQQQQQPQQHSSQDKKPPVGSAAVLLPTRVVHLLNQRIARLEPVGEPPNQLSAGVLKAAEGEQQKHHDYRGSVEYKRGNAGVPPAADHAALLHYNDGDGNQRTHAPKCSVAPLQTHTSSVLIETLLPEEWSY